MIEFSYPSQFLNFFRHMYTILGKKHIIVHNLYIYIQREKPLNVNFKHKQNKLNPKGILLRDSINYLGTLFYLGKMTKLTNILSCLAILFWSSLILSDTIQVEAKAFFVFGDSLVDNGNNNYLATTARADSPPYGIDYPSHRPTGRFSNGLNIPDIISMLLY